jgi:hypothetical protein
MVLAVQTALFFPREGKNERKNRKKLGDGTSRQCDWRRAGQAAATRSTLAELAAQFPQCFP